MVRDKTFCFLGGIVSCLVLVLAAGIALHFLSGGSWPTLDDTKNYADIAKNVGEILALAIAGFWTYRLFVKNRIEYPYPEAECKIEHFLLTENRLCLCVRIRIRNTGQVLLKLDSGQIIVEQVRPLTEDFHRIVTQSSRSDLQSRRIPKLFKDKERQVAWPEIGHLDMIKDGDSPVHLEPGETDVFAYEFIVDGDVRTVKVAAYFRNSYIKTRGVEREIGWHVVTLYDVDEEITDTAKGSKGRRTPLRESRPN